MASKAFTVFFNENNLIGQVGEGTNTVLTKAQAEERTKLGKEPVVVIGPLKTYNAAEITAENAEAACAAAVHVLGADAAEGSLRVCETSVLESKSGV